MQHEITPDYRVLLADESEREYRKCLSGLVASFRPRDYYEELLVEEFAAAAWVWRRARAVETALLHQVGASYRRGPCGIAEALFYVPDKFFRNHRHYMLDAERRYQHARRAVDEMRRRGDSARPPRQAPPPSPEPVAIPLTAARRAPAAKKRNEANPATRAFPEPAGPPQSWRELPVRNEPNRPPQCAPPQF